MKWDRTWGLIGGGKGRRTEMGGQRGGCLGKLNPPTEKQWNGGRKGTIREPHSLGDKGQPSRTNQEVNPLKPDQEIKDLGNKTKVGVDVQTTRIRK